MMRVTIMPSTITHLFQRIERHPSGPVRWGEAVPERHGGVYVVSLTADPDRLAGASMPVAPIDMAAVDSWLACAGSLSLEGERPTAEVLGERLSRFWLPDEVVLYIGKAGASLRQRIHDYYRTPLGKPRPHAGGCWLKVLDNLPALWVFWAASERREHDENVLLGEFVTNTSPVARLSLADPDHPFPFANLEYPKGHRKRHGIQHQHRRGVCEAEWVRPRLSPRMDIESATPCRCTRCHAPACGEGPHTSPVGEQDHHSGDP